MLAPGDEVRPKEGWLRGPDSVAVPPCGRVRSAYPFGRGQTAFIEGSTRPWLAGMFDKVASCTTR